MGECILTRRESPFVKIKLEGKTDGGVSCAGTFKLTSGTNSMYMLAPPLRSVPTIPDKTSWDNGYKHTKNVQRYVLTADDVHAVGNGSVNQYILIKKQTDYIYYGTMTITAINYYSAGYQFKLAANWDTVEERNTILANQADAYMQLSVALGTYADLAATKTALTGTVIYYQLATPIITPIPIAGDSDRIFSGATISPHSIFSQYYTTKISIPNTAYPIKNLLTIFKGATELDIADATIAGDKLSFTHTGLTEGDLVHITYEHTGAVTNTVEYE